ncbi:NAD-dependent epimerase/dehydratase family protein [Desulfurococcus mucosus]|uniref:NAD-dependent epimerase/dehydratase n=1 Tax=Desulfurococcus mucosus (strain ATCC 35584 / DSM 2162 / JCM 9187 / O7/1) TaxID=765177 RepID=E8R8X5_DESM0|nr:NAD-dependent epimerase/dehydratase family protein [Desulfurococcus mucosus]ADV64951.1 NAD-dependent epimerase/dehydratase [Desulfurococcus mucosus DSM 2162]
MSRFIVTGGAGFIGSHLVDYLVERLRAEEVIIIDNLSSGSLVNIKGHLEKGVARLVEADLVREGEWVKAFRDVDIVFHYAANPEVRVSTVEPRIHFDNNVVATFNVLEAMRVSDVKGIVFASSSTVYGEPSVIPTPEDHPLKPISVYGASKLASEALIQAYCELYGFKALILRYANIIGARSNHGVIVDFINKLRADPSRLEILGDGTQRKSYLHVSDAVEATMHLVASRLGAARGAEVYNIGNRDWVTVTEIADIVVDEMGLKSVEYVFKRTTPDGRGWPGDVKLMLLDTKRLESLGWRPKLSSRDAVRKAAREVLGKEH